MNIVIPVHVMSFLVKQLVLIVVYDIKPIKKKFVNNMTRLNQISINVPSRFTVEQ